MKHVRQKNLSCLPRQPLHILNILKGMITISEPAQLSASQHHSSSLIGILDCLPLQILQWPLDLLEFQSSSCISHASLLTKRVAKSLPPCHNLISIMNTESFETERSYPCSFSCCTSWCASVWSMYSLYRVWCFSITSDLWTMLLLMFVPKVYFMSYSNQSR